MLQSTLEKIDKTVQDQNLDAFIIHDGTNGQSMIGKQFHEFRGTVIVLVQTLKKHFNGILTEFENDFPTICSDEKKPTGGKGKGKGKKGGKKKSLYASMMAKSEKAILKSKSRKKSKTHWYCFYCTYENPKRKSVKTC